MADLKHINYGYDLPSPTGSFNTYIQELDAHLDALERVNSYWDMIRIADVANSASQIQSKINSLLPNTSLIINTNEDSNYKKGDIVVKKYDNSTILIPAGNTITYQPVSLTTDNTNIYINYQYQPNPVPGNISISGTITTPTGITTYNKQYTVASGIVRFPIIENLTPIIKLYSAENELVYADYNLSVSGPNYQISNLPLVVTHVVVK